MLKPVSVSIQIIIMIILLCFSMGCEEKQKRTEKKSSVVSQKITLTPSQKASGGVKPSTKEKTQEAKEKNDDLLGDAEKIYDAKNRIDPFEPLFKNRKPEVSVQKDKPTKTKKKVKRRRLTPLEKISLDQLNLVAVVRTTKISRALVEDASGKGYVISKGTYIGLHSGRVIKIDKDSITIEENKENLLGEYTTQIRELKLQKQPGD